MCVAKVDVTVAAVEVPVAAVVLVHIVGGGVVLMLLHVVLWHEKAHSPPDYCRVRMPLSETFAVIVEWNPKVSAQSYDQDTERHGDESEALLYPIAFLALLLDL